MHKKIVAISALSGVSIVGLIMAFGIIPAQTSNVSTFDVSDKFSETLGKYSESNANIRGPGYLPIKITGGEEFKTVEDAKKSSDVKITKPSTLPKGFELKAVYSKDVTVTQYYMLQEQEFTDETTFADIMNNGGFVIIQVKEDPDFDKQNWLDTYGKGKVKYEKIGDSKVIVAANDGTKGERSQLFFYDGDTFVNFVSVSLDTDELLKIANSLY